jgi:hypothetical protein
LHSFTHCRPLLEDCPPGYGHPTGGLSAASYWRTFCRLILRLEGLAQFYSPPDTQPVARYPGASGYPVPGYPVSGYPVSVDTLFLDALSLVWKPCSGCPVHWSSYGHTALSLCQFVRPAATGCDLIDVMGTLRFLCVNLLDLVRWGKQLLCTIACCFFSFLYRDGTAYLLFRRYVGDCGGDNSHLRCCRGVAIGTLL